MFTHFSQSRVQIGRLEETTKDCPTSLVNHLELLGEDLSDWIDQIEWPTQCKLEHLTMEFYSRERLLNILDRSSNLQTLVLGITNRYLFDMDYMYDGSEALSVTRYPQLTSLMLCESPLSMGEVE
jgi:hypothetical protein